jgi:hypothetical protein
MLKCSKKNIGKSHINQLSRIMKTKPLNPDQLKGETIASVIDEREKFKRMYETDAKKFSDLKVVAES